MIDDWWLIPTSPNSLGYFHYSNPLKKQWQKNAQGKTYLFVSHVPKFIHPTIFYAYLPWMLPFHQKKKEFESLKFVIKSQFSH